MTQQQASLWETETFSVDSFYFGKIANPDHLPNAISKKQGEAPSDTCSTTDSRDGSSTPPVPEGASPMKVSLQGGRGRALMISAEKSRMWNHQLCPEMAANPTDGAPAPFVPIPMPKGGGDPLADKEGAAKNKEGEFSAKNPRWWQKYPLVQACLVSRFPISLLPYPPYKLRDLKNCPTKYVLVDAKFLALQIISTQTFSAGKKRNLQLSDLLALDAHLERCRLTTMRTAGFWHLCEAAKTDGKQWEAITQMRQEANVELEKLKQIQELRLASLPEAQKGQLCSNRKLRRLEQHEKKVNNMMQKQQNGYDDYVQPATAESEGQAAALEAFQWLASGPSQHTLPSNNPWAPGYPTAPMPMPGSYTSPLPPTEPIKTPPEVPESRGATAKNANDIADKLERLVMLHATGALTDTEFVQAKSMALGL